MNQVRKNISNRGVNIERLLESKLIEADRNLMFSLALEEENPHISELCCKMAADQIDSFKEIGRVLLKNGYDTILHLNADITSKSHSYSVKEENSAKSVLAHNANVLRKMTDYSKRLISDDGVNRFDGMIEALNGAVLRDIAALEMIKEYIDI